MDVLENAVTEKNVLVEAAAFPTDDRVTYKDSTYEIVSKVAYVSLHRPGGAAEYLRDVHRGVKSDSN